MQGSHYIKSKEIASGLSRLLYFSLFHAKGEMSVQCNYWKEPSLNYLFQKVSENVHNLCLFVVKFPPLDTAFLKYFEIQRFTNFVNHILVYNLHKQRYCMKLNPTCTQLFQVQKTHKNAAYLVGLTEMACTFVVGPFFPCLLAGSSWKNIGNIFVVTENLFYQTI